MSHKRVAILVAAVVEVSLAGSYATQDLYVSVVAIVAKSIAAAILGRSTLTARK